MQWESMGFKDNPFKIQPIGAYTLELYSGNGDQIKNGQFALRSNNLVMVIEGARGVGATSFGNFLRFKAQAERKYFTPIGEIKIESSWNASTLMVVVIANLVSTLEVQYFEQIKSQPRFKAAKAMVQRVTETYRSFGASAFGCGANCGKSRDTTQPMLMPPQELADHLAGLVQAIYGLGFKYGVLIQLNNLEVGLVQNEGHLKMLLNMMCDYFHMSGTSWLLAGDTSLRRFIAQEIDCIDDIIAYEAEIAPLAERDYLALIAKRVEYFRVHPRVNLPVDREVLLYLHQIAKGRLRYIFGLLTRLFNVLQVGILLDRITLAVAKPVVIAYAKERISRFKLSSNEELILKAVVKQDFIQVKEIAKMLGKQGNYVSNILAQLQAYKLVDYTQEWRNHYYHASIDACIAYAKTDGENIYRSKKSSYKAPKAPRIKEPPAALDSDDSDEYDYITHDMAIEEM